MRHALIALSHISRFALSPFLLVVLTGCPSAGQDTASNGGPDAKVPTLSADSAYEHLKTQVAFGPRVPGTEAHARQLAWMLEYLRNRAEVVVEKPFTYRTTTGKELQLTNLFARFNASAEDRVLLVAHWDTRPRADQDDDVSKHALAVEGANDGASGTALLLEIANVLSRNKPPIGVDILLVDGEDYGPTGEDMYIGAKHFAANEGTTYRPLYGIVVDMIADQNPVFLVESNSQEAAPEVVDRVWRTAEQIGLGNYFKRTLQGAIEDDHVALNKAGIRTIDIIDFDYPFWHTSQDVLAHTAPQGLGIVGRVLLELIFRGG